MKYSNRFISLLLCTMIIFSCISCAKTPDNDIVVNKGDGALENKIENSTGNGLEIPSDEREYTETDAGYVFHETASFSSTNGIVTYNIDADVTIPKDTTMPVLKVLPEYWTPESLEKLSRVFVADSPIYEYTAAMTKDEIMEIILEKEKKLSDRDALLEYYGSEETVNYVVESLEHELSAAERDYENAPDYIERVLSDFSFHNDTYWYTDYSTLTGIPEHTTMKATTEVDSIPYFIWATQNERESYRWISYSLWACSPSFPDSDLNRFDYYQIQPFTQDEISAAIELINSTLSNLNSIDPNTTNWKIHDYTERIYPDGDINYYYLEFSFTPIYNGYEGLSLPSGADLAPSSENAYTGEFPNESLVIEVSNNKIMLCYYMSPLEISDTLNESVELLSYEEILDKIYTQLEVSITGKNVPIEPYTSYKVTSAKVDITKIECCLIRMPIKNSFDEYYMIPAWCVYGIYEMTEISNGKQTTEGFTIGNSDVPIFVLNAVDGSVISSSI